MSDIIDPVPEVTDLSLEEKNEDGNQYFSGRRFNNEEDVDYILPNDDDEADRLHLQHKALKLALGGNYFAPVKELLEEGGKVVDAGCGPAPWTFEMAKEFPASKLTGVDISFVFSDTERPANVELINANICKDMPFEENSIDYYHQRLLVAGLGREEFIAALLNAYRILKPGGYVELCEVNLGSSENAGPDMAQSQASFGAMLTARGLTPNMDDYIGDLLAEAGFVNVHYEKRTIPVNHTNKAGDLWWQDSAECMRSFRPMVVAQQPEYEDPAVYEEYIDRIGKECAEYKTNIRFAIAYAQKPVELTE
ncbi:S-adenosyl-L-methionine-dependent methyltransferase [Pilobolus umbonatus]|nr:S-adenosyl-L-methionine-dependent methyltransferase [Pilobolus umbonatus]